jgi:hypothetical protein
MSYEIQDLDFGFIEGGLKAIGEVGLGVIREQCAAQIDANGQATEGDWSESGALLSDVVVNDGGEIEFRVSYAEHVNAVHPYDGISPQFEPTLEAQLQPVLDQVLIFVKKE